MGPNARLNALRTDVEMACDLTWRLNRGKASDLRKHLQNRGARATFTGTATLAVDSTRGALAGMLAGAGFSILPDFMVREDIADGRLLRGLPQWQLPEGGIYAVFPSARFRAPRVTAFVEVLASMIRALEVASPAKRSPVQRAL
jgi:DNA-binding transcriptional LysR family regulator